MWRWQWYFTFVSLRVAAAIVAHHWDPVQLVVFFFVINRKNVRACYADKIKCVTFCCLCGTIVCLRPRKEHHWSNLKLMWIVVRETTATMRLTGMRCSFLGVQLFVLDKIPNRAEMNPRWNVPAWSLSRQRLASLWVPCLAHKILGLTLLFLYPLV